MENAPSEQVLLSEVAGADAISRDRDANSRNGIVRSNGPTDGNIPVATKATLSTQSTTTSLYYSSTDVVTSALGLSHAEHARASAGRTPPLLNRSDIGDPIEEQEQLHREPEWYVETEDF